MNKLLILIVAFCLAGCCTKARSDIRRNLLKTGQCQRAFLKEWGDPTRTYAQTGETKGIFANWGPGGGHFAMNPKRTYDLWYYREKGVMLVFYDLELQAWTWDAKPPQ